MWKGQHAAGKKEKRKKGFRMLVLFLRMFEDGSF